jgi:phage gp36-like protein
MPLTYVTANSLKLVMSTREIMELTTEGVESIDITPEGTQNGLDSIDGTYVDVLEDGETMVAFVVGEIIGWAEGEAESYVGKSYDLPLRTGDGSTPREFVSAILQVARLKLFSRRGVVPDGVRDDYEQAIAWLRRVADGQVVLNLGSSGTSTAVVKVVTGSTVRTNLSFSSSVY